MEIKVTKQTGLDLMRSACDKTFAGASKQSLISMYKTEHSPARTQLFWIECENIPLYVSTHLLRHHVGSQPFALTHRTDRDGGGLDLPDLVDQLRFFIAENDAFGANSGDSKEVQDILDTIKNKGGRMTPTNLGLLINAQSLIDMAKLRICNHASKHTREVFIVIKSEIEKIDPDLASMMVRKCVYRNGLCGESCGFNHTTAWEHEMADYLTCFTKKQSPKYSLIQS